MTGSDNPNERASPFLNVKDAEIVHGPDVIAEKVSDALKDAERFDLHHVKPPLAEALGKVKSVGRPNDPEISAPDALAGEAIEVDETAGVLKPGAEGGLS